MTRCGIDPADGQTHSRLRLEKGVSLPLGEIGIAIIRLQSEGVGGTLRDALTELPIAPVRPSGVRLEN